jgi:O-antigen biosynthesis protein
VSNALVIIPTFMRQPDELHVTVRTIESIRETEPEIPILCVDDCSPAEGLYDELRTHIPRLDFDCERKEVNSGFSRTVNVGLQRALDEGRDAVLLNADMELITPGWADIMAGQTDTQGRPAAATGALLIYPNGLIQHAGIFFSMLTRTFDHRYRFGPSHLPEANVPCCCPVTGAFQYIPLETLQTVGLYDESFQMAYEDVDFCLRIFDAGLETIFQPMVKAIHHESLFRGRADDKINEWQNSSLRRLMEKHGSSNMARFVPEMV